MNDARRAALYAFGLAVINLAVYALSLEEALGTLLGIVLDTGLVALFLFWKSGQQPGTPAETKRRGR